MFKPDELVYRALQRLPIRMLSLRAIVIFAALAVVVLVTVWQVVKATRRSVSARRAARSAAASSARLVVLGAMLKTVA